jgi:2-polyprenyl-3-methyl-5-hydroxy-6-metoxy-1,4-benzoquinol methylase
VIVATSTVAPPTAGQKADRAFVQARALATRLFTASLACAELMAAYVGIKLGLYAALRDGGPATYPQLAERAGIAPRYAREWLEQQAVAGFLGVDDPAKEPDERLYSLPPGHAEALTSPDSPFSIAPLALLPVGGMAGVLPDLLEAFRTGGGVPYERYGADFRGGQAGLNQSVFLRQLPGWIRTALPDVHARLSRPGARVADVACGAGWSSVALARTYPSARVDGFDLDEASVRDATANARAAGVSDRTRFAVHDAADAPPGSYDLVCVFDAVHDMARPVEVLRACRSLRAEGGSVLVMEPNVAERFTAPAGDTERFLYAVSLLHCLPVGMSEQPSAATGTALRPDTLRAYGVAAGFADVEIVPVEHRFHRLYRLLG